MQERETKEYVTTSGKKVVFKSYLTGREMDKVTLALIGDTTAEVAEPGEAVKKQTFKLSSGIAYNNAVLDQALISIDDISENVVDIALDLPATEFTDLRNHITAEMKANLEATK